MLSLPEQETPVAGGEAERLVLVLDKSLPPGVAMNAAVHLGVGLAARLGDPQRLRMVDYVDASDDIHPSISSLSFVVLSCSRNRLAQLRNDALAANIPSTTFLETMTGDTYTQQLERTRATPKSSLQFYGVALFGTRSLLDPLTRKFSLWK